MKILLVIIFLSLGNAATCQDSTKHYFKEIGWTIHLPFDFKALNSEQNTTIVNNGKKGIEQALDTNVNILKTINLISAKKSKNYFNATLTRNNSKSDSAKARLIKFQEETIYRAFSKDAKVDSSSTTMIVGTKLFRKFELVVHVNGTTSFNMNLLTKVYNEYYFVIAYLYLDKATKEQIESILLESTFSK